MMKKIVLSLLLMLTLVTVVCGCDRSVYHFYSEFNFIIQEGKYLMMTDAQDDALTPYIQFDNISEQEDGSARGTFLLSGGMEVSFALSGSFERRDSRVIATTNDGATFVFQWLDLYTISFLHEKSTKIGFLPENAIFVYQDQ